jgi:hypothetical protein
LTWTKGLANTGTWFIGRLQTERDKARVLDGLEGAAAGTGTRFDRKQMEQVLAGLGTRIFLLNNVHDDAPEVFETRWAMSYLRGPLTRNQIKTLMEPRKAAAPAAPRAGGVPDTALTVSSVAAAAAAGGAAKPAKGGQRPVLPPDIPQYFFPVRGSRTDGSALVYQPMLLGSGAVRFADEKAGVDATQEGIFMTSITGEAVPVNWERATEVNVAVEDLEKSPQEPAGYAELPAAAGKVKNYEGWSRDFSNWLYGGQKLELLKRPGSKECSKPGEAERDFRIRLQEMAREQRDQWNSSGNARRRSPPWKTPSRPAGGDARKEQVMRGCRRQSRWAPRSGRLLRPGVGVTTIRQATTPREGSAAS